VRQQAGAKTQQHQSPELTRDTSLGLELGSLVLPALSCFAMAPHHSRLGLVLVAAAAAAPAAVAQMFGNLPAAPPRETCP
jgi:hypothetical protein